jgi:hypothetical protein
VLARSLYSFRTFVDDVGLRSEGGFRLSAAAWSALFLCACDDEYGGHSASGTASAVDGADAGCGSLASSLSWQRWSRLSVRSTVSVLCRAAFARCSEVAEVGFPVLWADDITRALAMNMGVLAVKDLLWRLSLCLSSPKVFAVRDACAVFPEH